MTAFPDELAEWAFPFAHRLTRLLLLLQGLNRARRTSHTYREYLTRKPRRSTQLVDRARRATLRTWGVEFESAYDARTAEYVAAFCYCFQDFKKQNTQHTIKGRERGKSEKTQILVGGYWMKFVAPKMTVLWLLPKNTSKVPLSKSEQEGIFSFFRCCRDFLWEVERFFQPYPTGEGIYHRATRASR